MPGDAFRKPLSGQRWRPDARALSAMFDAIEANKLDQFTTDIDPFDPTPDQATTVLVQNSTGALVTRYAVLGIAGVGITPAANLSEFQRQVVFDGVTPTTASHTGKFVVTQEPIPAGLCGRAVVSGITHVKTTGSGSYADVTNSDGTQLTLASSGAAQVLYRDSSTGWSIVRLSPTAGGGGGGSIEVKEADGTPDYTGVTVLQFDQAQGFVLTNPSGTTVQVSITSASGSVPGIVTTGTQTFAGLKTFTATTSVGALTIAPGATQSALAEFTGTSPFGGGFITALAFSLNVASVFSNGFNLWPDGIDFGLKKLMSNSNLGVVTHTVTLAKITPGGTNGSMVVTNGLVTTITDPT
jgi:hypothetical protein